VTGITITATKLERFFSHRFTVIQEVSKIIYALSAILMWRWENSMLVLASIQTIYLLFICIILPFKHRQYFWNPFLLTIHLWLLASYIISSSSLVFWIITVFPVLSILHFLVEFIIQLNEPKNSHSEDEELLFEY